MQYGICNLSIIPQRAAPSDVAEQVSQLLYGEHFKVLETRKYWSRIRNTFDHCEGWVANNQFKFISEEKYIEFNQSESHVSNDYTDFVSDGKNLIPLVIGSCINATTILNHSFDGSSSTGLKNREELIKNALFYLNAPFLWGGKTPFGIDNSGFTQMVYKLSGYKLLREATKQATQGEPLSFIEESEQGDLAFFDDSEGKIVHVGIIMNNNYIIHSFGKVRIDRIDHTGIFNTEIGRYSHQLRVIKRIIP
ncbi:NlpC/P60 family protein [Ascidiimonas sp. W6]|uniref:C40 family peptidase n=1 Tax=Ascidiimonas meishanensis TaxID=3128903 RepID=UPI0030EDA6BA